MDLLELAERVEGLQGADREVDCLIREAVDPRYRPDQRVMYYGEPTGEHVTDDDVWTASPPYTASLDSAMSLVPANHTIQLSDWEDERLRARGPWQAIVLPMGARGRMTDYTFTNRCDHAATPALALTSAALKALASLTEINRGHHLPPRREPIRWSPLMLLPR
jgi:hypothetical protein